MVMIGVVGSSSYCSFQDVSVNSLMRNRARTIADSFLQPLFPAKCHSPQDAQRPSCSPSRHKLFDNDSLPLRQRHHLLRLRHQPQPRKPRTTSSPSSAHRSVCQTPPNAHSPRSGSCPRRSTFTQKARKRAQTQNCIARCCIRSRRRVRG
jgi:hypothetical protein